MPSPKMQEVKFNYQNITAVVAVSYTHLVGQFFGAEFTTNLAFDTKTMRQSC